MDDIEILNRVKVIVFEGPDCCGKTTMLKKTAEALTAKGYNVRVFKFPSYSGLFGDEILDHLLNWDPHKHTKQECFEKQIEFSKMLTVNKLDAFKYFCEQAKGADYVLVDRFVLSQYVYDIAWKPIIDKRRKNPFYTEKEVKAISTRAEDVYRAYSHAFPDIRTVVFTQNPVIKVISEYNHELERKSAAAAGRRIDQYDSNKEYQKQVAAEFDNIVFNENYVGATFINKQAVTLYAINSKGGVAAVSHARDGKNAPIKDLDNFNVKKFLKRKDYWLSVLSEAQQDELNYIMEVIK